jgi:hypothetical protein
MGKLHSGDDLHKVAWHSRLIFMGERLSLVVREVGHGAHHAVTPSHSQAVDLQVHSTTGTLINQHKAKLLEEITKQLLMGAELLMEDDKFLLECNHLDIVSTNGKQQEYWLLAIQAAREAS